MHKNFLKTFVIIFSCFLFLTALSFNAKAQDAEPRIISASENTLGGGVIFIRGVSLPNAKILLSVKNENGEFIYSALSQTDSIGNWSAKLNQPLKNGKYYIEAVSQDKNGIMSATVRSELINVKGPFALIIGIFSFLVIILLFAFVVGWFASKSAEIKRYRRILASQRDIVASYNVLKNDVDKAIKSLSGEKEDWRVHEVKFLLEHIRENLEKMNKYVVQGVNVIGKYDIVSKINNIFKIKK